MSNFPVAGASAIIYMNPRHVDPRLSTLCAITGFYGGLHLLAWNLSFGSTQERFLWRASGLYLVVPSLWFAIGALRIYLGFSLRLYPRFVDNILQKVARDPVIRSTYVRKVMLAMLRILFHMILEGGITVYILARAFLVIESCLQLGRLPAEAYMTPDWSKYYSHIA